MYFFEWGCWKMQLEPEEARKDDHKLEKKLGIKRDLPFESEDDEEQVAARACVSQTPKARGPVYVFNDTVLEIRSGMFEAKRGLISILSCALIIFITTTTATATVHLARSINELLNKKIIPDIGLLLVLLLYFTIAAVFSWFYLKYGFRFTRLEMFTSRHLLIRFNRKTQQVYLHRPSYCGGIVTLPWKGVTSSGASEKTAIAGGIGVPLFLYWSPRVTGTLHPESAWVGKAGNNQAELRDEWEFIRRFMDEGPQGLPRPRITSHFPWPWQAFTPQFEGLTHYFRRASRTTKVGLLLICPAFLIIGLGHWLSLLLCWKPRWPKLIRQAGLPGKPIPPLTTLADRPPHIQERLRANAHLWAIRPGKRPEKKLCARPKKTESKSN
ncbi:MULTISPECIES: DUF6708 domain-containing protein [Pseudomonas]|uniref:DUF6708 domain-containing protein n=1 Tax=Pseudomonas TaxID=286 RepID=UPI00040EA7FB|nr:MULTISPECIES: DUF6708 domain-containing protein [Pseudomonas]MCW2271681.1 hypothetical protein [Pseudomonas sp. JUb96]